MRYVAYESAKISALYTRAINRTAAFARASHRYAGCIGRHYALTQALAQNYIISVAPRLRVLPPRPETRIIFLSSKTERKREDTLERDAESRPKCTAFGHFD